ncbi:MAG: Eco57I restriction-modification methylase domain-containing protein [Anaerolineaceae bacterium]|jgi:hypothetical protein
MSKTHIIPYRQLDLKIYGYHLPDLPSHKGSVKVGETTQKNVQDRIKQQTGTVGIKHEFLFQRNAIRNDGSLFHDRDLHAYFRLRGIKRTVLNDQATEWYYFGDVLRAETMTDEYIHLKYDAVQTDANQRDYILRAEQAEAVDVTCEYAKNPVHGPEFLWNAKPRFGKTLSTYDFARKIKAKNILIVTNRPAIANSWYDDFVTFIAWQEPGMKFVSESSALADRSPMSREDFLQYVLSDPDEKIDIRCLAFISLQDLKGARFAGGQYEKLEWVAEMNWDLLVIDEAHEGIDTLKTDRAFDKINRKFTLHLSGTPFKAIASQKFHAEQIFNWSYLDEQEAKANWDESESDTNPYASLPTLNLFTYQMSKIVEQKLAKGMSIENEENIDYAFDLNEFFSTRDDGKFVYEDDVIRFLDNLHTGKFPFAENEYQQELNHSFWLLPRVAAAKAMERLLNNHPFFKDYKVVLAAGDGRSLLDDEDINQLGESTSDAARTTRSYDRVKEAIANNSRTITLSVGQLTTGVTIPEWTAVLMLSNIKSPAVYFQAAFRAQNPWEFEDPDTKKWYRKENAYVFDFAPDRTLVLFDEFANNLKDEGVKGTEAERKENIRELINFFPVIAEDDEGSLREISPEEVLTIPGHIKAVEVVKRGFMSNLLFANIGAIFAAPAEFKAILDKIAPESNKRLASKREVKVTDPMLNDRGEVEVDPTIVINSAHGLFGDKIYRTDIPATIEKYADIPNRDKAARSISKEIVGQIKEGFSEAAKEFGQTKKTILPNTKETEKILTQKIEENLYQHDQRLQKAKREYEEAKDKQSSQQTRELVEENYRAEVQAIHETLHEVVKASVDEVTQNFVEKQIVKQEEEKKKSTEDDVRDHLRGFARTIPAFLMAYGSAETTLANYDESIDPETFLELTSITLDEFRKLRDGIEIIDENGQPKTIPGLFNENVFNASIKEFFDLKARLADYLHGSHQEDIFDYIPPQRTNQIFTPRRVVKMMVDLLEENDPQIFTRRETTFIDLYAKSGLYLTEIAKRLFAGLADAIPDEDERIRWILEKQLYACAPSNIIYNMVKNYVYDGFPEVSDANLLELDLTEAAKAGQVKEVLAERYGKEMKFDVIIGNPPYQEKSDGGTRDIPVYNHFVNQSRCFSPRYISMIMPSRWMTSGLGLNEFRASMLEDKRIKVLVDYPVSDEIFPNVEVKGGVCYFLWDRDFQGLCNFTSIRGEKVSGPALRNLGDYDILIRDTKALPILEKVLEHSEPSIIEILSVDKEFGWTTNFNDFSKNKTEGHIPLYYNIKGKRLIGWIDRVRVEKSAELIETWKVMVPQAGSDGGKRIPDVVLGSSFIAPAPSVCTQTYLFFYVESKAKAKSIQSYLKTKFFRFLVSLRKKTQHATRSTYTWVPQQDWSVTWNDNLLYKKYKLTDEEIAYIESMIRPME